MPANRTILRKQQIKNQKPTLSLPYIASDAGRLLWTADSSKNTIKIHICTQGKCQEMYSCTELLVFGRTPHRARNSNFIIQASPIGASKLTCLTLYRCSCLTKR